MRNLLVIALVCAVPLAARAEAPVAPAPPQPPEPEPPPPAEPPPPPEQHAPAATGGAIGMSDSGLAHGSAGQDHVVQARHGLDVYFELATVSTSGGNVQRPDLDFTDLSLMRLGARYQWSDRLELYLGSAFLAKQPQKDPYGDEPFWQSSSLMLRSQRFGPIAVAASGSYGELMTREGKIWSGGLGLYARKSFSRYAKFEAFGRASETGLVLEEPDTQLMYTTAHVRGELQFRCDCNDDDAPAFWLGVAFRYPLGHSGDRNLLPPERRYEDVAAMDVSLGAIFPLGEHWQTYLVFSWNDRGDSEKPETQWPVIDGGFDQTQIQLGLVRHFDLAGESGNCAARGDCADIASY